MIDTRREARHIAKEFDRYQQKMGESIVWFCFDTADSAYSGTYNEGGRRYLTGINVPMLWVDQIEASEQYMPEGRRPVQGLRFAVSAKAMYEVTLSDREAHGHRVWDAGLINNSWFDDRSNDLCYYNGRYYEVSNYQIRGRLKGEDVIIGITCTETYPEDEYNFDFPPTGLPIAPTPPSPPDPPGPSLLSVIVIPDGNNPFLYSFGVNDEPGHTVHWGFGDGTAGVSTSEETVDHTYTNSGDFTVVAVCHQEAATADLTIEGTPPNPNGYGLGRYGFGPYGDPT